MGHRNDKDKSKVKGGGQDFPSYMGLLSDPRVHR